MQEPNSHRGILGLIIALILVLVIAIFFVFAVFFGFALFLFFPWLILIILFIFIWWIVRAVFGWPHRRYYYHYNQYPPAYQRTPEEVLDQRYAHGEITREEYLRMKEDMRGGR
jgi:putative membrane protein